MRTTVSRLRCRPGRVTQDLCARGAGLVNLIVPSIRRPFFSTVATRVRSRLSTHKCGVVLYGALRSSGGRHGCLSLLVTGGISKVVVNSRSVSVGCSSVSTPVITLSHGLSRSVPIITTSRTGNNRVTTSTFVRRNYRGIVRLISSKCIGAPSDGQRRIFAGEVYRTNVAYVIRRLRLGRFRFRACLGATSRVLSSCPNLSNIFSTSPIATTVRERTLTQKVEVPSSVFVFKCSNAFLTRTIFPPLPAITRPCSRVTGAIISILVGGVGNRGLRGVSCVVPVSNEGVPTISGWH